MQKKAVEGEIKDMKTYKKQSKTADTCYTISVILNINNPMKGSVPTVTNQDNIDKRH